MSSTWKTTEEKHP